MATVARAQESNKQAKGSNNNNNNNNNNVNLNKNEVDKLVDNGNNYDCDRDYMNKISEEIDYYKYNDNYEYNKEYNNDKNKEYNDNENKDYNKEYEMFQGACINLKGNVFDIGQFLKYKK